MDGFKSWNVKTTLKENEKVNGLFFTFNESGICSVRGSLHKFFNGGKQNANDYPLSDYKETLNMLWDNFGINPEITVLNGFEFGVNLILSNSPNIILNRLIVHKYNAGTIKSNYREFDYKQYTFKIYNKSELSGIGTNILRIEIKVKKMRHFKSGRIVLSDFLEPFYWRKCENLLIKNIEDCLFDDLDEADKGKLPPQKRIDYGDYINPMTWGMYADRKTRSRKKDQFIRLIEKRGKPTTNDYLKKLVRDKMTVLIDPEIAGLIEKKWDVFTVFQNQQKTKKGDVFTIKMNGDFDPPEQTNIVRCKGCGRIIPNPRKGQHFCSAKDVGYEQAHRCRNTVSNKKNNTIRSIKRIISVPVLFSMAEIIDPDKRQYLMN